MALCFLINSCAGLICFVFDFFFLSFFVFCFFFVFTFALSFYLSVCLSICLCFPMMTIDFRTMQMRQVSHRLLRARQCAPDRNLTQSVTLARLSAQHDKLIFNSKLLFPSRRVEVPFDSCSIASALGNGSAAIELVC